MSVEFKTLDNGITIINDKIDEINQGNFMSLSVTPDMIFEGRHGNSLRIGSRDKNPYIFIS